MSNPRRGKGRQKIEMKKMTNESNLQVTFSIRRKGLFKKTSELCTLCGAKVALIVFSPAGKAFSFGHPSVDTVIDTYQMKPPPYDDLGTVHFIEAQRNSNARELNALLAHINADLENENKCGDDLCKQRKAVQEQFWWCAPIQEINNVVQLDQLKLALKDLKKSVLGLAEKQLPIQAGTANHSYMVRDTSSGTRHRILSGSSSNNPLLLHQPTCPPLPPQMFLAPPPPQLFPVHPAQMLQNQPMMHPNQMNHPAFNNMGGFGPAGGFF